MLQESNLRPYQRHMIEHMLSTPKCGVWSFMGSGKTAATLTAIDTLMLCSLINKPTLVVAPLRVAAQVWPAEAQEWEHLQHLRVSPIVGSQLNRIAALDRDADIYTVNYENFMWLSKHCGNQWPFGMVVLDEATKVKSLRASIRKNDNGKEWVQGQGGQRAKEILRTLHRFRTPRLVQLSGTPAPNGLKDLWGQVFLLDYGKRLGRVFDAFKDRWFEMSFDGWGMVPRDFASAEIYAALKDICMSLKAEDWFDLSKPIERVINVTLPHDAREKYKKMEKELFVEIKGHQIEAWNAATKTQKLLQFASGVAYTGHADDPGAREWIDVHSAKLDALEEIVEEWAGQPILVAYQFKADVKRIMAKYKNARLLDHNPKTIKDWNDGKIPMLIAHPASAGHGLNLQRGSNVLVYYGSGWNYEEDDQIAERIGPVRQAQAGLNRLVYIYRIVAANTIEEEVLESRAMKCSVQEALMNAMRRRVQNDA